MADERRLRTTVAEGEPYVPELVPVADRPTLLMTRPWLEWARRVTKLAAAANGGGGGGGTGDVVGPSTSTNDAIAIYNGSTGKLLKDSLKTIANVVSDAVNGAVAAILPGGTLPASSLPANVALKDQSNTFTGFQQSIESAAPRVRLMDTSQTANGRLFRMSNSGQMLLFRAMDDTDTVLQATPLALERDGDAVIGKDLTVTGQVTAAGLDGTPLNATNLTSGVMPVAALPNHATRHQNSGADPIKLDDLATPDDNTDLNASMARHGLLPKLSGNGTDYLTGAGMWVSPAGVGDVNGPASSTADAIVLFNGTTGKVIKNSGVLLTGLPSLTAANAWAASQSYRATMPVLYFDALGASANQRKYSVEEAADGTTLRVYALDDVYAPQAIPLTMNRGGDIAAGRDLYEKGRTVALGHRQTVPFNAADFTAGSGGTWTVASASVTRVFSVIGQTVTYAISLESSAVLTGSCVDMFIKVPAGLTPAVNTGGVFQYTGPTMGAGLWQATPAGTIRLLRDALGTAWTAGNYFMYIPAVYFI